MSTVIQIKRSTGVSAPTTSDLNQGELITGVPVWMIWGA